jgi:hypothetical protein
MDKNLNRHLIIEPIKTIINKIWQKLYWEHIRRCENNANIVIQIFV